MTLLFRISFTHAKKASTSGFTDCCLLSRISCDDLPLLRLSVWNITAILSAASLAICCAGDNAAPFFYCFHDFCIFTFAVNPTAGNFQVVMLSIQGVAGSISVWNKDSFISFQISVYDCRRSGSKILLRLKKCKTFWTFYIISILDRICHLRVIYLILICRQPPCAWWGRSAHKCCWSYFVQFYNCAY